MKAMTKNELVVALMQSRGEAEQLRALNAEWAAESARLKRELLKAKGRSSANYNVMGLRRDQVPGFTDAVSAYCAKHGVRTCTKDELVREGMLPA